MNQPLKNRPSIWIGFEPSNPEAYQVAFKSVKKHLSQEIAIHQLNLSELQNKNIYQRPILKKGAGYFDPISQAPMGTEFAISRFFVPLLAKQGWALFMDSDMMLRRDVAMLFANLDPQKALYCVPCPQVRNTELKSNGLIQTIYERKNWSSFMIFNCDHPANRRLNLEMLNTLPGRDLHRFCWLEDELIGFLGNDWNYLVGVSEKNTDPANVHWTLGTPNRIEHKTEFADDFWSYL